MRFPFYLIVSGLFTATLFSLQACSGSGNGGMVLVPANPTLGTSAFLIDSYEDSVVETSGGFETDGSPIVVENARSTPFAAPRVQLDFATASSLCTNAGKRICTRNEWTAACKGAKNLRFGLQSEATDPRPISDTCLVARLDPNGEPLSSAEAELPAKTASKLNCQTDGIAAIDLIGNVSEWVFINDSDGSLTGSVFSGGVPAGPNYGTSVEQSSCDFILSVDTNEDGNDDIAFPETALSDFVGFRCCKSP